MTQNVGSCLLKSVPDGFFLTSYMHKIHFRPDFLLVRLLIFRIQSFKDHGQIMVSVKLRYFLVV